MNQQTLSLEDRTLLLIDTLSEEASDFIERLNDDFTDYMSGEITDPHQDMLDAIDNSGFSPAEIQNIKDYIFLDNVRNSSERIATDFIAAYLDNRYNPDYTLENFLISWNSEDKIFLRGEDELGSYGPIIAGIFDMLERSNELSGHMYVFDDDYLEGIKGFKKLGIVSTSVNNSGILYELFLGTLGEETRQRVEDIIYDTRLANEAANKFLDEFPKIFQHFISIFFYGINRLNNSSLTIYSSDVFRVVQPNINQIDKLNILKIAGYYLSILNHLK